MSEFGVHDGVEPGPLCAGVRRRASTFTVVMGGLVPGALVG
jgi:hypothetical protein